MSTDSRPRPGTVLDAKWQIVGLLGEGGMGAVYSASHVRNGLAVAIKILGTSISKDETLRQRFLSEGYMANRVGHPGCVRVLDDGATASGLPYLVMERLTGTTLEALAESKGGRLRVDAVLEYATAVADVLVAAHEQGIVHRDIKPENIFLCEDGTVKVLDFGIAHVRDQSNPIRLTVTGVALGTPAFMPPEQALAHWHRVGPASDVYALGATMFNLITGHLVHDAQTAPEFLVKVSTQQARPIQSLAPDVPNAVAHVIDKALSFEAEDRYPNAAGMLAALRGAALRAARETLGSVGVVAGKTSPDRAVEVRSQGRALLRETSVPVSGSSRPGPLGRAGVAIVLLAILAIGGGVASIIAFSRRGAPPTNVSVDAERTRTNLPPDIALVSTTGDIAAPSVIPSEPPVPSTSVALAPSASAAPLASAPSAVAGEPVPPRGTLHPPTGARTGDPSATKPRAPDTADPLGFH